MEAREIQPTEAFTVGRCCGALADEWLQDCDVACLSCFTLPILMRGLVKCGSALQVQAQTGSHKWTAFGGFLQGFTNVSCIDLVERTDEQIEIMPSEQLKQSCRADSAASSLAM